MIETLEEAKIQVAVGAAYLVSYNLIINVYRRPMCREKVAFFVDIYKLTGQHSRPLQGRRKFSDWLIDQIDNAVTGWWVSGASISNCEIPLSAAFAICEHDGNYKLLWRSTDDIQSSCHYIT